MEYNNQQIKRKYITPTIKTLFPLSPLWNSSMHKLQIKRKIIQEHTNNYNKNLIHNYSSYQLTKEENLLLCKGLGYAPPISSNNNANNNLTNIIYGRG